MLLNLITDRTQADVELVNAIRTRLYTHSATASDLALWNSASLKGSYNVTDLNRVGHAVKYLTMCLVDLGYHVSTHPKTDWVETDIPTQVELQRYLRDVATLKSAVPMPATAPSLPSSMLKLDYVQANSIEVTLQLIETWLNRFAEATMYSGDVYSGEF